ncbi:glycosyltransferase family 1 protein [Pistricoccus aurantiacus]|uniref:Glycosyltransferase family 1 protein n=1 Tax=Pistricoccus aurantiacus TaxID=1883414 RepID=A0A5B8SVA7_9GAMM|nr:glycosyltransferase [Pistricoccus aurantiacus]QEA40057.1 glycosyltransferase family 1 protein [Pistricoccus aurantiacus]
MINILHYGLSENMGGIETYLYKISSSIDKKEFSFGFIDNNEGPPCFYKELSDFGFDFHKVTSRKKSIVKNRNETDSLLKNGDFDILHCHFNTLSYIYPVISAMKNNVKVIVHSRNAGTSKSLKTNALHYLNSLVLPKDRIKRLAVSEDAGKWLFGKKSDFEIINNGVDIERFSYDDAARKNLRREFGVKDDEFLIGNVGAFLPAKNHNFLVDFFRRFLTVKKKSKLILVGDGSLKKSIEEKAEKLGISESIIFSGVRSDADRIYSAMDLFVFPSLYEGFGSAVLEAQTSGLPCLISSNTPKDVIVLKNCYQLDLSLGIDHWVRSAEAIDAFFDRSSASSEIEQAGYSVESEIKRLENIYVSALSK